MMSKLTKKEAAIISINLDDEKQLSNRNYERLVDQFVRQTTVHGLNRAAESKDNCRRILWIVLFIIAVVSFVSLASFSVAKYFQYPVETTIDVVFDENIEFPAVSICNVNPVRLHTLISNYGKDQQMFQMAVTLKQMREIINSDPFHSTQLVNFIRYGCGPFFDRDDESHDERRDSGEKDMYGGYKRLYSMMQYDEFDEFINDIQVLEHNPMYQRFARERQFWESPIQDWETYNKEYRTLVEPSTRLKYVLWKRWRNYQTQSKPDLFGERFNSDDNDESPAIRCMRELDKTIVAMTGHKAELLENHSVWHQLIREFKQDITQLDLGSNTTEFPEELNVTNPATNDEFMSILIQQVNLLKSTKSTYMLRKKFLRHFNLLHPTWKFLLGHQPENFIIDCVWSGRQCKLNNFTQWHHPEYGNCYSFNLKGDPLRTRLPGPEHGLTLELMIEQPEYIKEITQIAGLRMLIHGQATYPFLEDNGIFIMPGAQTSIAIKKSLILRQPAPYPSKCVHDFKSAKKLDAFVARNVSFDYSSAGCSKTCLQLNFIDRCKCASPLWPTIGPSFEQYKHLNYCITTVQSGCELAVEKIYDQRKITCHCPQPCVEMKFGLLISQAMWPSESYVGQFLQKINQTQSNSEWVKELIHDIVTETPDSNLDQESPMQKLKLFYLNQHFRLNNILTKRMNLARLDVFYSELNYQRVTQHASYPVESLLSELGGHVGLWLGLSILTLCEIMEFILDILVTSYYKRFKDNQIYIKQCTVTNKL